MRMLILILISLAGPAFAGPAMVKDVQAVKSDDGWRFDVTIEHADTGWEHYANGWGVYLLDGTELGYRVLHHPHVNEMPFTRSLGKVVIPNGVTQVIIRPRDLVHGEGADVAFRLPDQ